MIRSPGYAAQMLCMDQQRLCCPCLDHCWTIVLHGTATGALLLWYLKFEEPSGCNPNLAVPALQAVLEKHWQEPPQGGV